MFPIQHPGVSILERPEATSVDKQGLPDFNKQEWEFRI